MRARGIVRRVPTIRRAGLPASVDAHGDLRPLGWPADCHVRDDVSSLELMLLGRFVDSEDVPGGIHEGEPPAARIVVQRRLDPASRRQNAG